MFNFRAVDDYPGRKQSDRPRRLLQLLTDSLHLPQYFYHVEIQIDATSQLALNEFLHSLLRLLTNVKTLVLRTFNDTWSKIPSELLYSLQCLVSNLSLERLCLYRWRFTPHATELLAFLQNCAGSLRSLDLIQVEYNANSSSTANVQGTISQPVRLTKLKEMRIVGSCANGQLSKSAVAMPNLQRFHQDTDIKSVWWQPAPEIIHEYIPNTVANLSLTLRLPVISMSSDSTLRVPPFWDYTNIRHLYLIISPENHCLHQAALGTLDQIFAVIPPTGLLYLESVTIELAVDCRVNASDWDKHTWEQMASRLIRLVNIGRLNRVLLAFKLWQYNGPTNIPTDVESTDLGWYEHMVEVVRRIRAQLHGLKQEIFTIRLVDYYANVADD